jgi:hypothetical protein
VQRKTRTEEGLLGHERRHAEEVCEGSGGILEMKEKEREREGARGREKKMK